MRVLLTTDTVGGVWTFTRELTECLLSERHAVALVSFGRAPSKEQQAWVEENEANFAVRFRYKPSLAPLEWMQANELAFTSGSPTLLAVIREFKPDVIHSNQFCFGSLLTAIPRVITAHSDVLSWGDACRSGELEQSAWLQRYVRLVQAGLDAASAVVAPTSSMLSALAEHFQLADKAFVIPNGRCLPAGLDEEPKLRQAVSVGRLWDEAKGLATLLEVNSPVPILLAGEEQFEEALVGTKSSCINTLGLLSEGEILTLFRQSAIYIAASHYEPFGLAPLEAALCGCAVLARDIPSFREVWKDAAIYFRTPSELEQRLTELFASPAIMSASQTAAKQRAEEFTASRMTASYLALYEDLIQCSRQSAANQEELAFDAA